MRSNRLANPEQAPQQDVNPISPGCNCRYRGNALQYRPSAFHDTPIGLLLHQLALDCLNLSLVGKLFPVAQLLATSNFAPEKVKTPVKVGKLSVDYVVVADDRDTLDVGYVDACHPVCSLKRRGSFVAVHSGARNSITDLSSHHGPPPWLDDELPHVLLQP